MRGRLVIGSEDGGDRRAEPTRAALVVAGEVTVSKDAGPDDLGHLHVLLHLFAPAVLLARVFINTRLAGRPEAMLTTATGMPQGS